MHRFRNLRSFEWVALFYMAVVLAAGGFSLVGLLAGKDSVVLWPLALASYPASMLPNVLLFDNENFTFAALSESLSWLIPFLVWLPFQLAGILQATIVWMIAKWLTRRRKCREAS